MSFRVVRASDFWEQISISKTLRLFATVMSTGTVASSYESESFSSKSLKGVQKNEKFKMESTCTTIREYWLRCTSTTQALACNTVVVVY